MSRAVACLGLAAALGGCVAAWGKAYNVEFANSSSITIAYDRMFTNMGQLQHVAQEHCDKYGKDAVPQAAIGGGGGGIPTVSYRCINRT